MRKMFFYLPALVVTAGLLTVGAPPVRADDKADINALYAKITAAMKARNAKAIFALGTPDFTSTENGQTMNAKQSEQMMEMQLKAIQKVHRIIMKPTKMAVKGGTAVVTADFSLDAAITGPDKKPHKMTASGTTKDTLVKTPKGWMFKKVETLSSKTLIDGKPPTAGMAPPQK